MDYSRFTKIDAILDRADDYFEVKRYKESLPYIDEALLEIVLYEAETWFYKARALKFTGRLKEAFECFNKAYELAPNNLEYYGRRETFFDEELPEDLQQSLIGLKNNTLKRIYERFSSKCISPLDKLIVERIARQKNLSPLDRNILSAAKR